MEIQLKINNNLKKIYLGKTNLILGSNCSGKTTVLNTIKNGLLGKNELFLINGIEVAKGMYSYIYIDEKRDIDSEIQLKAKSYIKEKRIKNILFENEDLLMEINDKYIQRINKLFQEEVYDYNYSKTKLTINEEKTKKIENILFELVSSTVMSPSAKEEFYIKQRLEELKNQKVNLVIIDDIDKYLDFQIIKEIISVLQKDNIKVIISSKNKYLLNEIEVDKIFDTNLKEIRLVDVAKVKMFKKYFEKEDLNMTLDDYILQNSELFLLEDYKIYLKKEKINIINDLKI